MRRITHGLLYATLALAASAALAAEPVLKPGQVTEDALVEALTIETGPESAVGQTRSIRPTMKAGATTQAAGPGRASLLITFATGSSTLTPETVKALDTVGKALQSDRLAGFSFRVEGHADPRGGVELNLTLSEQRAQSVVSYLVDKIGIQPTRLSAVGKGSSELLNADRPEAPENRRVTIVTTR
jgi:outer membrane protein OmpA-like peptidoglycan-associated protein